MVTRPTFAVPLRHMRPTKLTERRVPFVVVLLSLCVLASVLLSPARVALHALLPSSARPPAAAARPRGSGRFCDAAPCVFDVGHNSGQDTHDYLTTGPSDVRVVAVDANPVLIQRSSQRFRDAVRSSRLRLVNVGLVESHPSAAGAAGAAGAAAERNLTFWINGRNDKFSSFREDLGCRDGWGVKTERGSARRKCHPVAIPTRTCAQLLREFGTPVYLKIDIEGMDMVCLRTLAEVPRAARPTYVSIENVIAGGVRSLVQLGYTKFKIVDQLNVSAGRPAELEGASGPWGEDAVDCDYGHDWASERDVLQRMPNLKMATTVNGKRHGIWYDIHGKLEGR